MPLRCLVFAIALLLVPGFGQAQSKPHLSGKAPAAPISIPKIARIAGFHVGYSTIEELEWRFGPGYAYTGGHPRGAREWLVRRAGWYLDTDGFDYVDRGRVIERFSLGRMTFATKDVSIPNVRFSRRRFVWMGAVHPGMTDRQVLRVLKGRLSLPVRKGGAWTWKSKGLMRVDSSTTYRIWTAKLSFAKHRLDDITVTVD